MDAFEQVRKLLSYLPRTPGRIPLGRLRAPRTPLTRNVIPEDRRKAYCVKDVIRGIVDSSEFLEVHEHFARNIFTGFARIEGRTVGIVANQPRVLAGVLDVDASDKAARFIRFCDAFRIP